MLFSSHTWVMPSFDAEQTLAEVLVSSSHGLPPLQLDLDVDIGRKVEAHQRVDGLGRRVDDVDEALVGALLEVLEAVFVLVRRTDDAR